MRAYWWRAVAALGLALAAMLIADRGFAQQRGPVEVTGELEVVIEEDFRQRRFTTRYLVRGADERVAYELSFERRPPGRLQSGQRVTVRGRAEGRRLHVETLDVEAGGAADETEPLLPENSFLPEERAAVVLIVDLADARASTRYSPGQLADAMWTGTRSVDGLYREASLGQLAFPRDSDGDGAPDVFGPFAIPHSRAGCDYYDWAYAAESAAEAAGVDLALYRHRVFVLPPANELGCGWVGIANVGCGSYCRAWIAEGQSGMVFAHELGHNLGMAHAGTDPENDGTINSVYGDHSDPMGASRSWHVLNAGHADQMGWYRAYPGSITTVVASGTYDIAAIGIDPATVNAPHILRIEKPDTGEFYYLSYRQPLGYDSGLSTTYTRGVNVHHYRGSGYGYTHFITALDELASFSDGVNSITVTQLAHDGVIATVEITFGCAPQTPSVALLPASLAVRPGDRASYLAIVTNNDGSDCDPTEFALDYLGDPAGAPVPSAMDLAGGSSDSVSLELATTLPDGSYPVEVRAIDADGVEPNHSRDGVGSATLVVDGTAPVEPTGLDGSADSKGRVQLSWSAAYDDLSGVAGYDVYRDDAWLEHSSDTTYTDSSAIAGATHVYEVTASDRAGNTSPPSAALAVSVGQSKHGSGRGGGKGKPS